MKRFTYIVFSVLMAAIVISACQPQTEQRYETRWAGETIEEIVAGIENQIGGFDQTMMETGYRYNELYWAGMDGNWGYAEYQLEEMLGNLEKGFVRRPEREASAGQFVNTAAPQLMATIASGNKQAFMESFNRFAASCNTCHGMEDVAFIQVIVPEKRTSLIRY